MAKTKISEYDSTAANNTDIDGVNLAEGCPPSGINNAIRESMAHLKDFQTGASGDNLTVGGTLTANGTTNLTGELQINGSAGTSGQYLKSQGSGADPVWSALTLGTMASQDSSSVNITGGSITGLTTLTTSGGTLTATTVTASTTLGVGAGWTVVQSGTDLIFKYSGTNKMKIDSSGNLTVVGNITAYGTV
jgi:hypothetical protein